MLTLKSGQWTAHEAIYWPDSDKLRHRYRYEGLISRFYELEFSPLVHNYTLKDGMPPSHTSNLMVCSGRRKFTSGSRANRLKHQNSVNFDVRPIAAKPHVILSTQSREVGDHGMSSGVGDLLARY